MANGVPIPTAPALFYFVSFIHRFFLPPPRAHHTMLYSVVAPLPSVL